MLNLSKPDIIMKKLTHLFFVAYMMVGCEKREIGVAPSNEVLDWYNVQVFTGGTSICSPPCTQNYRLLVTRQAPDKVSLSIYSNYVDWGFSTEAISYDLRRKENDIEFYQGVNKVGQFRNDTLELSEITYAIRSTPSETAFPKGTMGTIRQITAVRFPSN